MTTQKTELPQSQVRNPRCLIKINDEVTNKIISWTYNENNYYKADDFRVSLPLYIGDPKLTIEYWLSQPAIMVEILAGFPNDPTNYSASELDSLIIGGIDQLNIQIFDTGGGVISFTGRDLSSKFIDNKTTEKYPNNTASQIAEILAKKRGLTAKVTPTTAKVGSYYTQNYTKLTNAVSEWTLLTFLAQQEGYIVFVRDKTLYFQPQPLTTSTPYLLNVSTLEDDKSPEFKGTTLEIGRNFQYAKDVIVTVISWSARHGKVSASASSKHLRGAKAAGSAALIGDPQRLQYTIPGLSKEQALQRAQKLLEAFTSHERTSSITLPADHKLRKDSIIRVVGVAPSADQDYYPDTIARTMSAQARTYSMTVRMKNHSPQSVVVV